MPSTTASACPYVVGMDEDEVSENSSGAVVEEILSQAKKSCPAFSHQCPFSSATSSKDIQQTLLEVPQSHYRQEEIGFKQALKHLHTVSSTFTDTKYQLPGGCPVQPYAYTGAAASEKIPFTQALEEYSLAAIMCRMARDLEEGTADDDEVKSQGLKDSSSAAQALPLATDSATSRRLSVAFASGTAVAHQAAEDVHFVKNFIRGQIDRQLYGHLVVALYHVYAKLEVLLDDHAPTHFGGCHFPLELKRTGTLEEDVDFWHNTSSSTKPPMSPATRDYLDRLDAIAASNPLLLLAHAYTRYLGDLSGGKILARVARRALHLEGNEGLEFYHFAQIPSAKLFKDKYRQSLDSLELSDPQILALVEEANVAFLLNMRIFEELDVQAGLPNARVRPLEETLALLAENKKNGVPVSEECPFLAKKKKETPSSNKRCPWPFIFMHDPKQGLQDYQTWIVIGLTSCWLWSRLM